MPHFSLGGYDLYVDCFCECFLFSGKKKKPNQEWKALGVYIFPHFTLSALALTFPWSQKFVVRIPWLTYVKAFFLMKQGHNFTPNLFPCSSYPGLFWWQTESHWAEAGCFPTEGHARHLSTWLPRSPGIYGFTFKGAHGFVQPDISLHIPQGAGTAKA